MTSFGRGRAQLALAVLGAVSILPPYLGPVIGLELDVAAKVEVVDHVMTGVVVVVCGLLAALLASRDEEVAYGAPVLALTGARARGPRARRPRAVDEGVGWQAISGTAGTGARHPAGRRRSPSATGRNA